MFKTLRESDGLPTPWCLWKDCDTHAANHVSEPLWRAMDILSALFCLGNSLSNGSSYYDLLMHIWFLIDTTAVIEYGEWTTCVKAARVILLQMACHRLLQRGFAHLYSYKWKPSSSSSDNPDDGLSLIEYTTSALVAENSKDLHYKMKGARSEKAWRFLSAEDSSSYRTFDGTMQTIKHTKPLWFVMENVDVGDATEDDSNGAVIQKVMAEAGYETRMILLTATDFGLPQRRTRLFILGVSTSRAAAELHNPPSDVLDTALGTYLPKFKTTPLQVDDFLLRDTDEFVQDELRRRQKVRHDRSKRQSGDVQDDQDFDLDNSLRGGKWKETHMAMANASGVNWPLQTPDDLEKNEWFNTLPLREREVVIFVMNKNKDNSSTDEPLVRFADLYHSANRTPMSSHDVVPTILPSGTVWDCKRGRLLLGMEQLALQGIQFESPDILTNNQNQDLAGNAFPSTIMIALQISMICSLDYPSTSDDLAMDVIQQCLNRLR